MGRGVISSPQFFKRGNMENDANDYNKLQRRLLGKAQCKADQVWSLFKPNLEGLVRAKAKIDSGEQLDENDMGLIVAAMNLVIGELYLRTSQDEFFKEDFPELDS